MSKVKTCRECKQKESTGSFYYCLKRKWLIEAALGKEQCLCDDQK